MCRQNVVCVCVCLQMGPGNVSCKDSLLRSDRLMLVYVLYSNLEDLWSRSDCDSKTSAVIRSLNRTCPGYWDSIVWEALPSV